MDWEAFYNQFRQPDFVPGYEIQNRLGGGAFGEVYKARKASIGKAYAIKFLKIDDDAQRDAALRELEQVRHFAAIDHPNLVTIEDLGTVVGVPYLIMGYAGEETLARLMRRGRLETESALSYFVQTCRGVLALHDRRLVHFDLKPSNVFIKGDVARVGDYGLSKMLVDGRMTLSFGRGTPQYMAPEMIKNRADHRADIYSLGVMLYECLSGRLPFESEMPGALPVREIDVPPPFPDEFPARLRVIVERCLRLDPSLRYADVAELLSELGQTARPGDSIRIERPPATPVTPSTPRAAPPSSSRPTAVTSGASATSESATSEARSTAAELTRGAVEVARGVWDGFRFGKGSSTSVSRRASATSVQGPVAPTATLEAQPGSAVDAAERKPAPPAFASLAPALASATASPTIPVPPAATGSIVGRLAATAALAFEILVALLRGGSGRIARGWSRAGAASTRGWRWWRGCMRALRLGLFLVLLIALGTLVSLAFFTVLTRLS
jgi:eukaryotic-like serine/threonine-protein kinase